MFSSLHFLSQLLVHSRSPELAQLTVIIFDRMDLDYFFEPDPAWAEFQEACQHHSSLRRIVFKYSGDLHAPFSNFRESVVREMLPELDTRGLLRFGHDGCGRVHG